MNSCSFFSWSSCCCSLAEKLKDLLRLRRRFRAVSFFYFWSPFSCLASQRKAVSDWTKPVNQPIRASDTEAETLNQILTKDRARTRKSYFVVFDSKNREKLDRWRESGRWMSKAWFSRQNDVSGKAKSFLEDDNNDDSDDDNEKQSDKDYRPKGQT